MDPPLEALIGVKYRSDEYFEKREQVASASDLPSLIGVGYRDAWSVLQNAPITETPAMRHGTHYEPEAINAVCEVSLALQGTPAEVIPDPPMYIRDKYGATPDALIYYPLKQSWNGMEVKCPYFEKPPFNRVPRIVHVVQCLANMHVLRTRTHHLVLYAPVGHHGREQPELLVFEIRWSGTAWALIQKMLWHAKEQHEAGHKMKRSKSGKREWRDRCISDKIFYRVVFHQLSNGTVALGGRDARFRALSCGDDQ